MYKRKNHREVTARSIYFDLNVAYPACPISIDVLPSKVKGKFKVSLHISRNDPDIPFMTLQLYPLVDYDELCALVDDYTAVNPTRLSYQDNLSNQEWNEPYYRTQDNATTGAIFITRGLDLHQIGDINSIINDGRRNYNHQDVKELFRVKK